MCTDIQQNEVPIRFNYPRLQGNREAKVKNSFGGNDEPQNVKIF